jgi:hypothetical protein
LGEGSVRVVGILWDVGRLSRKRRGFGEEVIADWKGFNASGRLRIPM